MDSDWFFAVAQNQQVIRFVMFEVKMSLGAKLYLLLQDLNKKRCKRCSLHYGKHHDKCPHCSDINDFALKVFLEERGIDPNAKSGLGQFLFFAAIIMLVIFFLSRF